MFQHTSFTLNHQIERACYEFHNWPAIVHYMGYHRRSFTYGELRLLSHRMAVYLENIGFVKGDRIAVWAANSPEWVVLMLGCSLMGLILVPIDTMAQESFAKNIYEKSKSKSLFSDRQAVSWAKKHEKLTTIFEHLPLNSVPERSYIVGGSDTLQIVYTSGTTSEPKGVVLTHQNLLANINSIRDRFVYPDGSSFISFLPLSHLLEQVIGCYGPLIYGCKIVYVNHRPVSHMLRISLIEKTSHMTAVPALLDLLKKRIETRLEKSPFWKRSLFNFLQKIPYIGRYLLIPFRGSLRMIVSGGATLKPSTQIFFQKLGIDVICGYGMTEASPVITCQNPHNQTPGQVGKALPRQFLRLSEEGEILVFGDNVSKNYFENEEATAANFTPDGWLKTGDIGSIDESGNLTLLGRIKEMILTSNGMNIFPQDIETVLESLAPGSKAVVVEDPLHEGHLIAALKAPEKIDLQWLIKQANNNLSDAQKLSRIEFWSGDFPRTHTMKIQRAKVKSFFANQTPPILSDFQLPQAISLAFELSGKKPVENWKILHLQTDLGFDSIQIVQLWMRLQNDLGFEIGSDVFEGNPTLEVWLKKIESRSKTQKIYLGENCHRWTLSLIRCLSQPLLNRVSKAFFPVQEQNSFPKELLNLDRPIMIICNHTSHMDILSLLQVLPNPLKRNLTVAAARDYFFEKIGGLPGRCLNFIVGTIGFSRSGDHESNMQLLEKNWNVSHALVLMPEGTRSRTGELLPLKKGAAWIASQFHAVILPIQLKGCFEIWPASSTFPQKKGPISLKYMPLIDTENYSDTDSLTQAMTNALDANSKGHE
jgi:long-chain acyl-CoA synthetase